VVEQALKIPLKQTRKKCQQSDKYDQSEA
jgi:hypothetical protein